MHGSDRSIADFEGRGGGGKGRRACIRQARNGEAGGDKITSSISSGGGDSGSNSAKAANPSLHQGHT